MLALPTLKPFVVGTPHGHTMSKDTPFLGCGLHIFSDLPKLSLLELEILRLEGRAGQGLLGTSVGVLWSLV